MSVCNVRTLHAPRDVKVLRTLDTTPRHSLRSQAPQKKCSPAFCLARTLNFLLNGWEHFSAGLSALNASGRRGSKRIPSQLALLAVPPSLPPPMLDLFCAVWIFGFFGMVGGARGGFPLRRKLTEFNAVIENLVILD